MFNITVFEKAEKHGPLSKKIALRGDTIVSDGSECRMSQGRAAPVGPYDLHEIRNLFRRLTSRHAIALGQINEAQIEHLDEAGWLQVVSKRAFADPGVRWAEGVITRSQDFISFRPGPGLLLLDVDFKACPPELQKRVDDEGGAWAVIQRVVPELAGVMHARRASTSAGLINAKTGEAYESSRGEHIYLGVQDATDIKRTLDTIFERLWLAGYGWIYVSDSGSQLSRTVVDKMVSGPERLVFEGPAELGPGLQQDTAARELQVEDGDLLDTREMIIDLDAAERVIFDGLVGAAKEGTAEEARVKRNAADEHCAREIVQASKGAITHRAALEQARARHEGRLMPDVPLIFDNPALGTVLARDVLANIDKYIGATLRDPLEPSYGACKAMILRRNAGEQPVVHSYAHGSHILKFTPSPEMVITQLQNGPASEAIAAACDALIDAGFDGVRIEQVLTEAARRAGVGVRQARRAWRERQERAAEDARNAREADARRRDPRPIIHAPYKDQPLAEWCRPVDRILAAATRRVAFPPVRDAAGRLARIEMRSVRGMHTLGLRDENGDPIPAPTAPVVTPLGAGGIAMLCEEYMRVMAPTRDGGTIPVRVQETYAAALNELPGSAIPILRGVQQLPLLTPDGKFRTGNGLDEELGIIFDVPRELADALPLGGKTTLEEAKAAYEALKAGWLGDVATDEDGKAVLVSAVLTVIQRLVLEEKPGFIVRAGMVANGKSTTINMITALATGKRAAASPWPENEDERRKGLLGFLLMGVPAIVYDNVPRGSTLSSASIEAAMTTGVHSDRILGSSQIVEAPMTSVLFWSGNAVSQSRDMASRLLDVVLTSDRADPENRPFAHEDVVGWTIENRIELLAKIYAVLTVDVPDQPEELSTEGRFKSWMRQIGRKVEAVSGVSFSAMMKVKRQETQEGAGLAGLLKLLQIRFKASAFRAVQVAALLNPPKTADTTALLLADDLREAFAGVNNGVDFVGEPNARAVGRRLSAQVGAVADVDGKPLTLKIASLTHGVSMFQVVGAGKAMDADASEAPLQGDEETERLLRSVVRALDRIQREGDDFAASAVTRWLKDRQLTSVHLIGAAMLEDAQALLARARNPGSMFDENTEEDERI